MKKQLAFILLSFLILFSACKKEENIAPVEETPAGEEIIEISTSFGKMYMWLYKSTPKHRENFLKLAKQSYFDSTTFHRIIRNFVIQGGDPNSKDSIKTNDGSGGPDYTIPIELNDSLKHIRGAVGAARDGDDVNPLKASSGSQFYICMGATQTSHLNKNYTVFGFIMKGMDVADKIVVQSKDANDRPVKDIKMSVKVIRKTLEEIKIEYLYEPKF
jgi:cyclophilin family peptidyl-prolyl cis-trans isomerase